MLSDTNMSEPLVTFDDALATMGNVPHIGGHLNTTSIHNLANDLCDKLETIPSHQFLPNYGYMVMVEAIVRYALNNPGNPWIDLNNPDVHRVTTIEVPPSITGGVSCSSLMTTTKQANATVVKMPRRSYSTPTST